MYRHETGQWGGRAEPAVVYFFIREEGARHTPAAFCLAVNSQLLDMLGLPGGVPAELEAQRSQLLGLWAAASGIASATRPLLLLVDGLGEMATGPVTIADLLPAEFRSHVHVLVASRSNPEPLAQVPAGHPLRRADVTRLQTLTTGEVAALLAQHGSPAALAQGLAGRVVEVTGGEPLLARFVTADVAAGGEAMLTDLERDPPAGVKDYFARQFRQLDVRAAGDTAWEVLGLLLVARGAVSADELAAVLELPSTPAALAVRVAGSVRVVLGPDGVGASVTRPAPGSAGPVLSTPGPPGGGGPRER